MKIDANMKNNNAPITLTLALILIRISEMIYYFFTISRKSRRLKFRLVFYVILIYKT